MREEMFGNLRVRLTGGSDREGGGDGPLLMLMHGFGAPGDDLVPLWRVLDVPAGTRFAFPEAPLALPRGYGGGRAWWMIDLERMARSMRGETIDRDDEVPEGMPEARDGLLGAIDAVERALAPSKLILGGFSQGAMMACEVAFSTERRVDGLVVLSGTLMARARWAAGAAKRKGLPALQSHGRADPLLPFGAAERLRDLMVQAGVEVEWIEHGGGHEIPDRVVERLGALVGRI
jgi:phospholipase/carboxylesterase